MYVFLYPGYWAGALDTMGLHELKGLPFGVRKGFAKIPYIHFFGAVASGHSLGQQHRPNVGHNAQEWRSCWMLNK